jgi:PAS domain S-box-containing protein
MKTEHKVLVSAFLIGILVAVIVALLDFLFFYEGTFLELLIFNIPPHEFYIRSVVVICFISFGFVVGRVLNHREQAVEHSEYLYSVLSAIRNVNQLIVKETNHDVLLQRACELLIETRGYYHSWIVLLDDNRQLKGSASAGVGIEFEQMLEMVRRGERGECMKRAMEQSGVLVFDVPPLEHKACPIEPLCRGGVALVTRLESRVGIHGVLGVGAPVGMAAEEELSLFKEVADDIAYALYTFEVEDTGSRAHLALMENEKRFRLLYEDAPLCYQSLDEAGRFVEVNKAWLNCLEYSREEVIGRSFEEFLAPEEWDRFWAIFHQFEETGEIHDVEFWMVRKDGSRFIASYDGTFTRGHSKQTKVCHCIFRDVTEQRRMEDELEESEKRHRMILSSMNDMIFVLDEHDCYSEFYASPSLMPYRTPEEFLGKNTADILPLEIAEQIMKFTKRVRETGNREILEYKMQMNENELWFSAALDLHQDGESVIAVVREITERKEAEDALRQSEQMYRALFESANDAIFIMMDNLFIECNDIALKMFGCNREEILFHSPDEFSPKLQPDGSPSKKRALKRIRAALAGEPQFFEWKHTRCDGAFFDAEVGLNAVQVGDELAVQAIVRNITDRKRAEKEIKATAEAAFLYLDLMGHDIRNHLQAIVMGTEILTSTDLDANLSSVTDLITESVERSRNLIQKVQVTRGLLAVPLSEKSLRSALEDSLKVLKATYEDLEIEVDYKIRRAIIKADQYLVNLLMNDPERRFGGVGIHQALRIAQKYDGHVSVDNRVANDSSQGAKFQLWLPKLNASAS